MSMSLIVTSASLRRHACGLGVMLVNEYGNEVDRSKRFISEPLAHAWEAQLLAIKLGIELFGTLTHTVYNDSKLAVDMARTQPWRVPNLHCIVWWPHHLRKKFLHEVVLKLADEARQQKSNP